MSNLSAKSRFLTSIHAADHLKWARSDVAKAACEAAIAEMALTIKGESLQKLEGASHFANLLLNLSEPTNEKKRENSNTLKYDQPKPHHHD